MLIYAGVVISGGEQTPDSWVSFDEKGITARGTGMPPSDDPPPARIDARGLYIVPGFVDIHGHGGAGGTYYEGGSQLAAALAMHRSRGVTRSVLSLSATSIGRYVDQLNAVRVAMRNDSLILGAHLEGPYLSDGHRGSHDPRFLRDPTASDVATLIRAGENVIRQITIAPELPGALTAIQKFAESGAKVAIGHTSATFEEARDAFDAGATILTHTFNGMPSLHHRDPGPLLAAFQDESVWLELINDFVHVQRDVVALLYQIAPHRVVLITDAMAAAGAGDGNYRTGTLAVTVRNGVPMLEDGSSLSGSTLTLDVAVRNAVQSGLPIESAIYSATEAPARALGEHHRIGRLDVGYVADFVLLDQDLSVRAVWADGQRIG